VADSDIRHVLYLAALYAAVILAQIFLATPLNWRVFPTQDLTKHGIPCVLAL
jgi:hypothetical protein